MDKGREIKKELAMRELARRHYRSYLKYVNSRWRDTRLARFLAETVEAFVEGETGNAYDILIIAAPPQHGKSMTVTESLPSWYHCRRPEGRILIASYNEGFAERFCRKNREKIKRFGKALAGVEMGGIDRATEYELAGGGSLISRGIMSGITGNPADLVIIDDPIKNREEADSPAYRERLWQEWQNSIKSRLCAGAKVILIMTPWHEDDLRARMLETERNAVYVRLPVAAEKDDPLGRAPGQPLCPELGKDERWLEQFRDGYVKDPRGGARAWAALYMCSPRTEKGNMVSRDWWRFYRPESVKSFATELISVDCAFKGGDSSDFVAISVWGKLGGDYYLRYCLNRQLSFTRTLQALRTVKSLFPNAGRVLIEDKANGSAVIDTLSREMLCIPIDPKGGKIARVNAVSPAIEAGHVYLPEGESWLEDYLEQWSAFPAGAHDDMVDSSTQALSYMLFSSGQLWAENENEERKRDARGERAFLDGSALFDVY